MKISSLYSAVRTYMGHRQPGFDFLFDQLEQVKDPFIVETGCARVPDNWDGDGQSSLLFDDYIDEFGGEFMTVDISPESTKYCSSRIKCSRSTVVTSDSIQFLYGLNNHLQQDNKKINVLYLDSFDAPKDDEAVLNQSAGHHLYELCAIIPSLKSGCLIGVDDNWLVNGNQLEGKGKYIYDFFKRVGLSPVFAAYQIFWRLP